MDIPVVDYYAGFPEVSATVPCDQYGWSAEHLAIPPDFCSPVIPSGMYIASYDLENAATSTLDSPSSGYQADFNYGSPFGMNTNDYAILLDLMLPAVDFSHPQWLESTPPGPPLTSYRPPMASQQYPYVNQRPSSPGYEPSRGPTPARQGGTPIEMTVVRGPPTSIWNYIKIRDDRTCVCLWEGHGKICGFKSSLDQVKKHLKRMHYVLKPHGCPFCENRFFNKMGRDIHVNVHTGHKPYQCQECEEQFTSPSARSYHRKVVHRLSTESVQVG